MIQHWKDDDTDVESLPSSCGADVRNRRQEGKKSKRRWRVCCVFILLHLYLKCCEDTETAVAERPIRLQRSAATQRQDNTHTHTGCLYLPILCWFHHTHTQEHMIQHFFSWEALQSFLLLISVIDTVLIDNGGVKMRCVIFHHFYSQ